MQNYIKVDILRGKHECLFYEEIDNKLEQMSMLLKFSLEFLDHHNNELNLKSDFHMTLKLIYTRHTLC